MINLTTAEKALKDIYLEVVSDQLNTQINPFMARIKQTESDVYGNDIVKLVPYGVNGGIGAGTETGALPTATGNKYARFEISLKNLYGSIEISDKAIRASQNNAGAFVNLLNAEMDGLIKSSQRNLGRMLFGDGTGLLTNVYSTAVGNLITVFSVSNLAEGMVIDIIDSEGEEVALGKTVLSIDRSGSKPVIKLDGADVSGIVSAGNGIYVQGSKDNEITGLEAIFGSSASLYGLSRANNAWVTPLTYNISGTLTETAIQRAIDEMEEFADSRADIIVCSLGVRRALYSIMNSDRSIVNTVQLDGGYSAITYNGIPVIADRFCPAGVMYILNSRDFNLHQLCDWRWLEGEDGKILKQKAGEPVYTATLVKYAELICNKPRGQAKLYGITES